MKTEKFQNPGEIPGHDPLPCVDRWRFTLIELMVVIFVILIIFGMLLPTLQGAKQTALTLDCMNILKQWSIVRANYSTDNNTIFPGWWPKIPPEPCQSIADDTATEPQVYWWHVYHNAGYYEATDTTVSEYYLKLDMNWCRTESEMRVDGLRAWTGLYSNIPGVAPNPWKATSNAFRMYGISFAQFSELRPWTDLNATQGTANRYNSCCGSTDVDSANIKFSWGSARSFVASPELIPMMGDARSSTNREYVGGQTNLLTPFYGLATRHGPGTFYDGPGKANILFADGHVESRQSYRINPTWPDYINGVNDVIGVPTTAIPAFQEGVQWLFGGFPTSGSVSLPIGNSKPVYSWP